MKQMLAVTKTDSDKVNLLNQLSRANEFSAADSGIAYGQKALALAEKIDFKAGIVLAEINLSGCYNALANFRLGLYYALKALSLAQELNDHHSIIRGNAKLGECYY
ncbi:MAG: hypothetical protein ICV84_06595, partial [Flavisolibacter sp.]|nr:hypothetical protein [Flavisolibacter sp.]